MKITNLTNAFGTVTAVLAMLMGFLTSIGCAPGAVDFSATCSIPWLPEQWLPYAGGLTGIVAFIMKLSRPGGWLHSLFGSTAVMLPENHPNSGPGTATPEHVAAK